MENRKEEEGASPPVGITVRNGSGSGVEKIVHALVYHGVGPCEKCGRHGGSFRHATYKYSVDERYGVTTRVPQLWCGEGCCLCCIEEKKREGEKAKKKEATHV